MRYAYACQCGNKKERVCSLSEFKETIRCPECKGKMHIDIVAQQRSVRPNCMNWPMESDALGVAPEQAKEYAEYLRERGVPTEINSEGNPILTSREHRRRVCEATGAYDRNAGYGDRAPSNTLISRGDRIKRREARRQMIDMLSRM